MTDPTTTPETIADLDAAQLLGEIAKADREIGRAVDAGEAARSAGEKAEKDARWWNGRLRALLDEAGRRVSETTDGTTEPTEE